jgi:hypothetical protein
MGDLEGLLLVVAAIYLAECVVWVPRGAVVFHRYWIKTWRLLHPSAVIGNDRGGLFLANPLPPLGTILLSRQFMVSLSPEAAYSYTAASINPNWRPIQLARHVGWEAILSVEVDGKAVFVNAKPFFRALSPSAARLLAGFLRRVSALKASEREAAIRQRLAEAFDGEKISARLAESQTLARPVRWLANVLFAYVFVLAPILVWQFGFGHLGWALLAGLLAQTITAALLFRRAHRALFPDASAERFTPFVTMLLAPPTAIRAHDLLSRHLLERFHPLAVARVLCPSRRFEEFARRTLLDLRYPMLPICPAATTEAARTEEWSRQAVLEAAEKFIERVSLRPEELLKPPAPAEARNLAYCPRCGGQFLSVELTCGDCGGRPLERFS